ncbi:membrane-bound lytic murein transglycosylase D [Moraxella macacae 0408225]|uniref:Membrane-bound lytic murein transglycosylase D n=1 Tax=Moraxella macacae 0408225 TaxID=1230338 RepID=L2F831_9GAMM|nr:LysM peptidoglycan-binding domain-containing protein [Moraxella macacae]ELA08608.1 membrane-bound lytic murein transglycosylase D [Moraxella macacae 0408225]
MAQLANARFGSSLSVLTLAVSTILLAACSSAPPVQTQRTYATSVARPTHNNPKTAKPASAKPTTAKNATNPKTTAAVTAQQNAALLDMDSLDELEGLLEATDMAMVENSALLVQQYGNLWDRLRANYKMGSSYYDPRIEAQKSWFISRQDYLNRLTARASRYLYHTVREAERRNIPAELALLPVIESSYDPNATSNAAAAGLWQFIPSTGRIYGLNQTSTFDGRRDVIESTRAAYDFLTSLYNQFGSWELALAAYNAGPGRVSSAIRYNQSQGLSTDYWSLRLPTETMNYVPRFMAVAQIVKDPNAYGVSLPAIANRQHFRSVPTNVGANLSEISRLTGVSYDELRALNGGLLAGSVDISGPSRVLIPNDVNTKIDSQISRLAGNGFVSNNSNGYVAPSTQGVAPSTQGKKPILPKSSSELASIATNMVRNQTTTYVAPIVTKEPPISAKEQHQVTAEMQSANTLPTTSVMVTPNNTIVQEPPLSQAERDLIAKQIEQTSPQVSQAINPTDGNIKLDAIQTQQSVLEAKGETKKLSYNDAVVNTPKTAPSKPRPMGNRTTYQVKRGDTLSNIAGRMGVNWRDIAEWNQIDPNAPLLADSTLYLYNAKLGIDEKIDTKPQKRQDSYVVQAGDTLTGIADKFNLSVNDLAKYNNLSTNYQVKTKQTLWLIPDKVATKTTALVQKPTKKYQGATGKYTVQAGDTLIGIANKLDVSAEDIAELNDFNANSKLQREQSIVVPVSQAKATHALMGKEVNYTVKRGDNLNTIANKFDVSVKELASNNGLKPKSRLKAGQIITIPQAGKASSQNDTTDKKPNNASGKYKGATESYRVKSGESLNSLATKYDLSVADLAALNNLKTGASLQRGQSLKVPKLTTTYKVRSGDSMTSVAKKFNLSPKALAGMNDMTATTQLKTGQVLTVPNK